MRIPTNVDLVNMGRRCSGQHRCRWYGWGGSTNGRPRWGVKVWWIVSSRLDEWGEKGRRRRISSMRERSPTIRPSPIPQLISLSHFASYPAISFPIFSLFALTLSSSFHASSLSFLQIRSFNLIRFNRAHLHPSCSFAGHILCSPLLISPRPPQSFPTSNLPSIV